jgi:WD40 repeat protein
MIYELVQEGKITNVLCPTSQYVITAGTNTLINVWELGKGRHKRLHLKTRLSGHNDMITYLTASQAYRILISGSDDQTCIVWDLNRLHFIRQLPNHAGSISCICVNELTVNLFNYKRLLMIKIFHRGILQVQLEVIFMYGR